MSSGLNGDVPSMSLASTGASNSAQIGTVTAGETARIPVREGAQYGEGVARGGLLNADQAKAMFQHCLIGKPAITEERVIDLKQKYTLSLPVVVQDEPEAHNVYLQVGNQRFCVTPMYCESLEEANHMRTMLANALANLLAAEGNKP